jgi:hypothetical protein
MIENDFGLIRMCCIKTDVSAKHMNRKCWARNGPPDAPTDMLIQSDLIPSHFAGTGSTNMERTISLLPEDRKFFLWTVVNDLTMDSPPPCGCKVDDLFQKRHERSVLSMM